MITACAAACHVSPAWQQSNKLTDPSTAIAMKSILPSNGWLYNPSSQIQRTDMHTWAWKSHPELGHLSAEGTENLICPGLQADLIQSTAIAAPETI